MGSRRKRPEEIDPQAVRAAWERQAEREARILGVLGALLCCAFLLCLGGDARGVPVGMATADATTRPGIALAPTPEPARSSAS